MTETAVPPSPVPIRERGYAHDQSGVDFWGNLSDEPTPELQWPACIPVYDRMRKQDAQVASVLRAVTSPIIRTGWSIDGSGGVDENITKFVAANLGLPITGSEDNPDAATLRGRDRFSWPTHLRLALLMLPFGHSIFEQVYRPDDEGLFRLRKLGERLPKTIQKFNVARDGGLVSIEQREVGIFATGFNKTSSGAIPVKRLVAYVNEREGGNWYGTSLLRSAYKFWLLKDQALRTWSVSIERNGIGSHVYTAAPDETDLAPGKKVATGMRAGTSSGVAIAQGAKLEIKGVDGDLPDIEKFVRYCDEQIARAVLAHFLNLGTQTGSWALGSTFADFFTLSLQAVAAEIRDTANAHVIEDLVDINFGPDVPAPRLVFDEIGSRSGVATALDDLRKLAGLEDDEDLEKFIRTHVPAAAA